MLAIVLIIIAVFILLPIGIYLFERAVSRGESQKAYTWILLILALILAIIGGIWLAVASRRHSSVKVYSVSHPTNPTTVVV